MAAAAATAAPKEPPTSWLAAPVNWAGEVTAAAGPVAAGAVAGIPPVARAEEARGEPEPTMEPEADMLARAREVGMTEALPEPEATEPEGRARDMAGAEPAAEPEALEGRADMTAEVL